MTDQTTRGERTNPGHEVHVPLWQSLRKSPRVVLYCVALSSAILLYGYDLVIVGTVSAMPAFQYMFGEQLGNRYIIPATWLSLWNVASPIGTMFGAVVGGALQDRSGRRMAIAIGSLLSAVAVAILFVSDLPDAINSRRGVFLAGKGLQGICIGILLCVVQTYMSEVLPITLRGPIIAFLPIFTLLGQLIGSIVTYTSLKRPGSESYRVCLGSQWAFSAVPLVVSLFLPESPTWLLRGGQPEKALKAQRKLDSHQVNSSTKIEELQISILAEAELGGVTYMDCFKGIDRRRTLIVALASALPQFFGLQLMANSSYFMQMVGMSSSNSLIFLILGIGLGLIANVASLWTINFFGRRLLCLVTLETSTVLWLAMGIAGCFKSIVTIWWSAVTLMVMTVVCGMGVWPASHVVAAEASALQLRAKAQGVGFFTSGLAQGVWSVILPYMYNPDAGNLKAKIGFVMAGFALVGALVAWLYVPEMKDRSPMEIDRMFAMNLAVRSFKKWQSDVSIEKVIEHDQKEPV